MPPETIGDRIRQLRERRELTQVQLAEKAGLPAATISHFETDIRTPGTTTLQRLAEALEVTVDYLLGREDDPAPSGPETRTIFRNLAGMTDSTLKAFAKMSEELKKLDEEKRKD
jgi:transcriptional regulator with XRE-family HTH domain